VHASPSLAMLLAQDEEVLVDDYHVDFPATSDRLLTTDADGIHCLGNRGGLEIRKSSFAGMADDAINIHGRAAKVLELRSAREIKISTGGTVAPRVGEEIAIYDPEGGRYRGRAKITSVVSAGASSLWLTLTQDIKGIIANAQDLKKADWLFNLDACGQDAKIHHNTFGRHRGRSLVLRALRTSVYENTFKNADGAAINILLNGAWGEGPIPGHITLSKNTFTGVDRGDNSRASPAISTSIIRRSGGYASSAPISDVTVQNNVFEGLKGLTMRVSNATAFQVLGNWTNNTRKNKVVKSASIDFRPGTSATLNAYAVSDKNPETYAGIHIKAGAKVTYQGLKMDLAPGIPWVRDDNP
ncbi:MAG: hypothetical protein KAI47_10180, partial [Deltaproteobacteria bacterium]|nr:hypothetical protein [Deltaproteobacteria bacterium]